jgi:glucans biosynthesis protein
MHGGAKGSGAPRGNSNALKHGTYTKKEFERRANIRNVLREAREFLREIE